MSEYQDLLQTLALTLGVAWASGINLYAVVTVLGIGGATGYIDVPPSLEVVQDPLVIVAAAFMYCIEFMADKTPGVDTAWDALHTFIRIPAGALLAAGAVGPVDPALAVTAGLIGGTITAATHATKAGARVLINTSPEPFTNWAASITEDIVVIAGLWTAIQHPVLFLCALVIFLISLCWLLPKLARGIAHVFRKLGSWLGLIRTDRKALDLKRLFEQGVLTQSQFQEASERLR